MNYIIISILLIFFRIELANGQTDVKLVDYFKELKSVEVNIGGENYNFLFDTGGGSTKMRSPLTLAKTES